MENQFKKIKYWKSPTENVCLPYHSTHLTVTVGVSYLLEVAMKSAIRFESLQDRLAYKRRERARLINQREIIDEADHSTAMLGLSFILALGIVALFAVGMVIIRAVVV